MKWLLGVVLVAFVVAGCGNAADADVNGSTGITVGQDGSPIVLVMVCHSTIDQVTISADRTGLKASDPNVTLGTWKAASAQKGLVTLDVAKPASDWASADTFHPVAAKGYIVIASQAKADVEAEQVYFHGRDLAKLTPDQVLVGDAKVEKRSTFEASCD